VKSLNTNVSRRSAGGVCRETIAFDGINFPPGYRYQFSSTKTWRNRFLYACRRWYWRCCSSMILLESSKAFTADGADDVLALTLFRRGAGALRVGSTLSCFRSAW
jgi:hypothetical protein